MADRKPIPAPHMRLARWLAEHRQTVGLNGAFAAAIVCSEGRLSQILGGRPGYGRPSASLAARIENATDGAIALDDWFSDLTAPARRRRAAR